MSSHDSFQGTSGVPYLIGTIDDIAGPVVQLTVGVDHVRQQLFTKHSFPVPQRIPVRAQIDTGSGVTAVDPQVLRQLDLTAIGSIPT
jgi:hypothetical protein